MEEKISGLFEKEYRIGFEPYTKGNGMNYVHTRIIKLMEKIFKMFIVSL